MQFNCCYMNKATKEKYWRMVSADTLNEALAISDKYARKGYICVGVISTTKE